MTIVPLELEGACLVRLAPVDDARGRFVRTFCAETFARHGLQASFVQANLSLNARRGTLRGLHYQRSPHGETKLIRCTRGALYDVIVDVREASPTRGRWTAVELHAEGDDTLYVPAGFAHGFQALADDTELHYQMGSPYVPEAAVTLSYRHASLDIPWPLEPVAVSEKDASADPHAAVQWT